MILEYFRILYNKFDIMCHYYVLVIMIMIGNGTGIIHHIILYTMVYYD